MSVLSIILKDIEVFQVRNPTILSKERVVSVDALRGFDMFWIIGGDIGFPTLDKVFHNKISGFIKLQFDHSDWLGFRFEDIIMPLFLFLVGVSMVYSYRKRISSGSTDSALWIHTIKRIVILWVLGMIVQGQLLTYDPHKIELYSNTLQAIASGYLIATIFVLYFSVVKQVIATLLLMLSYWAIVSLFSVPGSIASVYSMEGNVPNYIDQLILGQFRGWWQYSWIIPSLNFGATVMLGVFCGYIMQSSGDKMKKFQYYMVFGILLIILGQVWNIWHPVIKKIWTSSFVLFSGGICILMLGIFYLFIDVWGIKRGIRWMIIIGSNAIFAYVAWHLFYPSFISMANVFLNGLKPWIGNWIDALGIFGATGILYLILWYMYRNKTFIKI